MRATRPRSIRFGTTVTELLVVMIVTAALAAIALPRLRSSADRFAARAAAREIAALFSFARRSAITRRAHVAVMIDTAADEVVVRAAPAVLARVSFRERYGVLLWTTRDSMSYDPRGLGYGAANLTVVARRGAGSETLSVSRLGRVRR